MAEKKVLLSYGWPDPHDASNTKKLYRVEKVTGSLDPHPGDFLDALGATEFLERASWTVTIVQKKEDTG